jgi:hypothetical protein
MFFRASSRCSAFVKWAVYSMKLNTSSLTQPATCSCDRAPVRFSSGPLNLTGYIAQARSSQARIVGNGSEGCRVIAARSQRRKPFSPPDGWKAPERFASFESAFESMKVESVEPSQPRGRNGLDNPGEEYPAAWLSDTERMAFGVGVVLAVVNLSHDIGA